MAGPGRGAPGGWELHLGSPDLLSFYSLSLGPWSVSPEDPTWLGLSSGAAPAPRHCLLMDCLVGY